MTHPFLYYLYSTFFVMILVELVISKYSHRQNYSWQESLTSLGVAVGHQFFRSLFAFVPTGLMIWAWQHRLGTVPMNHWWGFLLLFIGVEFCYYWYHRSAHKIRWLWANHAVHHSVNYFNLSAAYRLGWTSSISGDVFFFMPLCFLGFHPVAVAVMLMINLFYQFWLHSELIPKLGVLEWILNTPSHHRVHHASNPQYLDCNYGGITVLFDRLFGTIIKERSTLLITYGLTHPVQSHNPLTVAFFEWKKMFKDLLAAKTWQERCRLIFGSPT